MQHTAHLVNHPDEEVDVVHCLKFLYASDWESLPVLVAMYFGATFDLTCRGSSMAPVSREAESLLKQAEVYSDV